MYFTVDSMEVAYLVGVVLGREEQEGMRVGYTTYINTLHKWVRNPEDLLNKLISAGKAKLMRSGHGHSIVLTDRELIGRINTLLTPKEEVDPLGVIVEGIRRLANPLTGYADIGDLIKYIVDKLEINTKDAEDLLINIIRHHRRRFVFAHGGSKRLRIGSSYYGLIKVIENAEGASS
ncbi:hypothetical protein [Vulcanisaeta thermophila]|uniref:hypothetical protein n=1 Tax=Vulcanisaeta thermophila TaxID=867917 RepID=UPI001EE32677|nr:hypothetical protein [Vulcanisaeta thermophila]